VIEPMITKAKTGKLAARRQLLAVLPMPQAVKKLFEVIAPRYQTRAGGYTRITAVKVRPGDGAKICKIELV
jgi:large subunit ribosomal protein L17